MNSDAVVVKIEPADDFEEATSVSVTSPALQNGTAEKSNSSLTKNHRVGKDLNNDPRNFTCLLCDIVCNSRGELIKHLKKTHSSKTYTSMSDALYVSAVAPDSTPSAFSGYVNHRYMCQICGAKFKSFRTYLTHSMSHSGSGVFQKLDEVRMAALFGNGKQYMQDYMEVNDGYAGTFICSECKTIFTQRDSYAMHMMMRAMNETCKYSVNSNENISQINSKKTKTKLSPSPDAIKSTEPIVKPSATEVEHQRCLEDVTSKIDQDEYLKSVLDKVCVAEIPNNGYSNYHMDDRKLCSFCKETFVDQDSLAMHVMSDHTKEMSSSSAAINMQRSANHDYLSWMTVATRPMMMHCVCKYCNESFLSNDSLALHVLTHAHMSEKTQSAFKRKLEVSNPIDSVDNREKIQKVDAENNIDENPDANVKLFCDHCNIQFYAISEYEWHMRGHFERTLSSPFDEPLCLTKTKTDDANPNTSAESQLQENESSRMRRNSFSSFDNKDLRINNPCPARPMSVGDFPKKDKEFTSTNMVNEQSGQKAEEEFKSLSREDILKTINALSVSEQRIIYSVFGRDLTLKKSNECDVSVKIISQPQDESKSKCEEPETLPAKPPKDMRTDDSPASGVSKQGEQDSRKKLLSGDKEAPMCKYCEILFFNKAIYYLHMGLHNVNNPWQCNVCGKVCNDAVDFATHVIHM